MPTRVVQTRYFEFRQNNSGGSFDIDDERGIGPRVWIEASDLAQAIGRAESIGIYFDGVDAGRDCECCGDRWYPPYGEGALGKPDLNAEYDFNWHSSVYVHQLDGEIVRIRKNDAEQPK